MRRDLAVGGASARPPTPVTLVPAPETEKLHSEEQQESQQVEEQTQPTADPQPGEVTESDAPVEAENKPPSAPERDSEAAAPEAVKSAAVPSTPPQESASAPDPDPETANLATDDNLGDGDDFDFGLPTTDSQNLNNDLLDNDNISALLPGLQDYANTQPDDEGGVGGTDDPDFDAIFGDGDGGLGEMGEENGDGGVDGMESFLDFDFAADFAGGEGETGGGDGTGETGAGNLNAGDEEDFFKFD